jgi:ADP-ribose pyrophosphatase YjhB (NUDIX family)
VLLVCRAYEAPYLAGAWALPGCRVEAGELPSGAAVRATSEAAGVVVEAGELVPLGTAFRCEDGQSVVDWYFRCERYAVVGVLHEHGSASRKRRPQLAELLDLVQRDQLDVVVSEDFGVLFGRTPPGRVEVGLFEQFEQIAQRAQGLLPELSKHGVRFVQATTNPAAICLLEVLKSYPEPPKMAPPSCDL